MLKIVSTKMQYSPYCDCWSLHAEILILKLSFAEMTLMTQWNRHPSLLFSSLRSSLHFTSIHGCHQSPSLSSLLHCHPSHSPLSPPPSLSLLSPSPFPQTPSFLLHNVNISFSFMDLLLYSDWSVYYLTLTFALNFVQACC